MRLSRPRSVRGLNRTNSWSPQKSSQRWSLSTTLSYSIDPLGRKLEPTFFGASPGHAATHDGAVLWALFWLSGPMQTCGTQSGLCHGGVRCRVMTAWRPYRVSGSSRCGVALRVTRELAVELGKQRHAVGQAKLCASGGERRVRRKRSPSVFGRTGQRIDLAKWPKEWPDDTGPHINDPIEICAEGGS